LVRQADGSSKQTGPIKRKRDDMYLVDCTITGSNNGTSKTPKCSLQRIFEHNNFPAVRNFFGRGGQYEGYKPVLMGDSAGPHIEKDFIESIWTNCEWEGWAWEPHAAQIPHINVLDLAVFPSISRCRCSLACKHGGLCVLKEDEIWEQSLEVWRTFPNCKIVNGHVLSHWVAQKVIDNNGDDTFLSEQKGLHSNVRHDFDDTRQGNRRKDGKVILAPAAIDLPPVFPPRVEEGGRG